MNNFKYNWRGTAAEKWRYQDEDLENKYRQFILDQEKTDEKLIKEIKKHHEKLLE